MKTKTKRNKIIHEERVLTRLKGSLGLTNLSHSKSESPDFILHGFSGNIGVEITELLESDTKEHSSIKSNLTDRVIDLLDEKLLFPFILDIAFEAGAKSRKVNSQRVIELYDIFKGIGEDLENHQRIEFFKFDSPISDFPENIQDMIFQKGYKNLPEGVSRVSITREDFLSHSYNSQREGGLVPCLTIEKIQETIDKKNRKLAEYQSMYEQWLVLEEGNGIAGRYASIPINGIFESLFDRIFIVRIIDDALIELNLRRPIQTI